MLRGNLDRDGLGLILDALEQRQEALARSTVEEIREQIPAYGELAAGGEVADIDAHVRRLHGVMRLSLSAGRLVTTEELAFIRPHAETRARGGISLADWLKAFRVGHRQVLAVLLEVAAAHEQARAAALSLMEPLAEFIDVASTHAAEAYLEAQQDLVADSERTHRDLLEELLAGEPPRSEATQAAAAAAGLTAGVPCVVVVASVPHTADAESGPRSLAREMARAVGGPLRPLAVVRHDEIVLVRALRDREIAPVTEALRDLAARRGDDDAPLAASISTLQDGVDGIHTAYREALVLLRRIGPRGGVTSLSEFSAFDYLTSSGDQTARRLVPLAVRRFVEEDLADGGLLVQTLSAYADADLNTKAAAHQLNIHPNTAHYRLARIAEKTGCDLRHLPDVLNILIAVRLERATDQALDSA